jgi:periplasmic glucans biosynthesis protein
LRNPTQLQVSSFTSQAPRAFGLMQRSRRLSDFHDLEAQYEGRPNAWVEPTSEWGPGEIQLVEIPTDIETNDNIVAMWKPKETIVPGKPWHTSYRIRWTTTPPNLMPRLARVIETRSGPSFDGKRRLFVVEFVGAGTSIEGMQLEVGASAGKVSHPVLQPNRLTKGIRASFELSTEEASVAELRMRIVKDDRPVTETWLYRWTAS